MTHSPTTPQEVTRFAHWLRTLLREAKISQVQLAQHLGIGDKNKISRDLKGIYLPAWLYVESHYLIPLEEMCDTLLPAEVIAEGRLLYAAAEAVATPHLPIPREHLEQQLIVLTRNCADLTQQLRHMARTEAALREELSATRIRNLHLEADAEHHRIQLAAMHQQALARDAELTRLNTDLHLMQAAATYSESVQAELAQLRAAMADVVTTTTAAPTATAMAMPSPPTDAEQATHQSPPAGSSEVVPRWKDGRIVDIAAWHPASPPEPAPTRSPPPRGPIVDMIVTGAATAVTFLIMAGVVLALLFIPAIMLWGWPAGPCIVLIAIGLMIFSSLRSRRLPAHLERRREQERTEAAEAQARAQRQADAADTSAADDPHHRLLIKALAGLVDLGYHAWQDVIISDTVTGYIVLGPTGLYAIVSHHLPASLHRADLAEVARAVDQISPITIVGRRVAVTAVAVLDAPERRSLPTAAHIHTIRAAHLHQWISQRPQTLSPGVLRALTRR